MLLFSTVLAINDTLTHDKFIELVIEWNQKSLHTENIIPNLVWSGERNIRFGDDGLWMDIQEYRNENIIAVRCEKIVEDGVIWDTDYVMNFDEMKMSIQLDRSFTEDALVISEQFSTPHFITMLIENGYLADDGVLPVLREPFFITEENIGILADVMNGNQKYDLPVVYVSKTADNEDPVHTGWLASRLKGVAHVLVQSDRGLEEKFAEVCCGKNEQNGAIGIYYPTEAIGHKQFGFYGQDVALLNNVVREVIQYANAQNVDSLYTWYGVNQALLVDRLFSRSEEKFAAELELHKNKAETNELLDEFESEMQRLQRQVDELRRSNDSLRAENLWMQAKLSEAKKKPMLYFGQEEEFYPGEIKDMILSVLEDSARNGKRGSRRVDVMKDVVENNDYQHLCEERKAKIKKILRGYDRFTAPIRQELADLGFEITEEGKHYKLTYYGDPRYWTTVAKTPSDNRAGDNDALTISGNMF